MNLHRGLPLAPSPAPTALAIGNFDGVHRGHQALIDALKAHAQPRRLDCAVMTFEPHPRVFFAPSTAPARVSTLRDRLDALAAHGVDTTFLLRFNQALAAMSPQAFVEELLVRACRARFVMVGEDFRFGARRAGDVTLLKQMGAQFGFTVACLSDVKENDTRISSTLVRNALAAGDMALAAELLGRPYAISGHVIHGAKLGRTLDFPTLNLRLNFENPAARGIFAVRVHGLADTALNGVASLGLRPTVDAKTLAKQGRWLLETHLFDWQDAPAEAAYGKIIRVELISKLRDEEKYSDLATLKAAIAKDAAQARAVFSSVSSSGVSGGAAISSTDRIRVSGVAV
jgi:riboflavin kinase / FMN adenylyltransferase